MESWEYQSPSWAKQIYPDDVMKDEVFDEASDKRGTTIIPEGIYHMKRKVKVWSKVVTGQMKVESG